MTMRPAPLALGFDAHAARRAFRRDRSRRRAMSAIGGACRAARRLRFGAGCCAAVHEALGVAHRQPCATTRAAAAACCAAGKRQQRARMAHVELARAAGIPAPASRARVRRSRLRHRAARAADGLRRRLVRQSELVDQPLRGPAPPRADSGPRAGCSRSARARAPTGRARLAPAPEPRVKPARCAARQRRSPAMISKRPPSTGRTRIGCMTPCSRSTAASSSSDASSIRVRGWYLPGRRRSSASVCSDSPRGGVVGARRAARRVRGRVPSVESSSCSVSTYAAAGVRAAASPSAAASRRRARDTPARPSTSGRAAAPACRATALRRAGCCAG